MMRGKGGEMEYFEKPNEWRCLFEGVEVISSPVPLDFCWILPLDGCIDHWGQPYLFSGEISVKARVHGDRTCFSVNFALEAEATVKCARCLADTPLEILRDFMYFYNPLSHADPVDGGNCDDDIVFLENIEGRVDVSDQVWESLILSLPEKVLCSPDCRGICPICGRNMNKGECTCSRESVDPRFEILAGQEPSEGDNIPGKGGNQRGNSKK